MYDLFYVLGRDNLWLKTKAALTYITKHHLNDADWFLKADDDTYVILENLRYFLSFYDPRKDYYFGHYFYRHFGGYQSGGAGYVLSRNAVSRVSNAFKDNDLCKETAENEDEELGSCLRNIHIEPKSLADELGRELFHYYSAPTHLKRSGIDPLTGASCCSNYSISFHYVQPREMYLMEYLIYHFKYYGNM